MFLKNILNKYMIMYLIDYQCKIHYSGFKVGKVGTLSKNQPKAANDANKSLNLCNLTQFY